MASCSVEGAAPWPRRRPTTRRQIRGPASGSGPLEALGSSRVAPRPGPALEGAAASVRGGWCVTRRTRTVALSSRETRGVLCTRTGVLVAGCRSAAKVRWGTGSGCEAGACCKPGPGSATGPSCVPGSCCGPGSGCATDSCCVPGSGCAPCVPDSWCTPAAESSLGCGQDRGCGSSRGRAGTPDSGGVPGRVAPACGREPLSGFSARRASAPGEVREGLNCRGET